MACAAEVMPGRRAAPHSNVWAWRVTVVRSPSNAVALDLGLHKEDLSDVAA